MFEISRAVIGKVGANITNPVVVIFFLALLPGCATVNTAQAESAPVVTNVCNADTDTFCVEGDKESAARLNQQGLQYAAKQDYDQSLDLFRRAIALDNSNPQYHYNLGVTYSFKGMVEEEESAYMNVLTIESEDPKANPVLALTYFNLACMYALQGKNDQAFVQLEKLFTVDPRTLYHYLQADDDLKSMRADPRFKQLVAKQFGDKVKFEENFKTGEAVKPEEPAKPKKSGKSKKSVPSEVPVK